MISPATLGCSDDRGNASGTGGMGGGEITTGGNGGAAGNAGSAGTAGNAGTSGTAGAAGSAGTAGNTGGTGGSAEASWPNSDNTGPSGTLTPSGSLTINTDGTTIDALDISGCITVNADNVTISNTRVRGGCFHVITNNGNNLVLQDVEVDGLNEADDCLAFDNYSAYRVDLHNCADGAKIGNNTHIEDSYIHDLSMIDGCHCDGVQTTGGTNTALIHNAIIVDRDATSAVQMGDEFGSLGTLTFDNNYLDGGGYTFYGGWNQDTETHPSNLTVTNNAFGTDFNWGTHVYVHSSAIWSGNYDLASGDEIVR
ncbi:MAG: hypothetical protein R3A47_05785 [Polyangiales bacterium]